MQNKIEKLDCGCEYEVYNEHFKVNTKTCKKHVQKINIEELKIDIINQINNKTKNIILNRYTECTQRNISLLRLNTATNTFYTINDRDIMLDWIDSIRRQGKEFRDKISTLKNIEAVQNFIFDFKE